MNWMAKPRPGAASAATGAAAVKPGPTPSAGPSGNLRISNGLKEFLWLISDVPHGRVLDLGPVWQSTVSFFVDKGYRVSTETFCGRGRISCPPRKRGFGQRLWALI